MKFLKGFLVFLLMVIIIGGLGFIGYNLLFMNLSGQSNTTAANSHPANQTTDTADNAVQNHSGMTQNSDSGKQAGSSVGLNQANIILQNKDSLNKSLTALNGALKLLTVDPYAPNSNSKDMGNMTMQNMGTVYDPNKMEQLHNGLYKISLGVALLNQLQNQLVNQAENASVGTQDLVQYYTNQYNLTVQNKSKLTQAMNYINEAASLVNINPYVSSNGLVYDRDRMNQIHQSVFKLAEGVASLNLLSDDLTRQSIVLSNTVQTYINTNNNNASNTQVNHTAVSNSLFGGLFENINIQTVVNVILIVFIIGLILGILGFILNQLKPAKKNEVL